MTRKFIYFLVFIFSGVLFAQQNSVPLANFDDLKPRLEHLLNTEKETNPFENRPGCQSFPEQRLVFDSIHWLNKLLRSSTKKNSFVFDYELGNPLPTHGIGYMRQTKYFKVGFRLGGWKSRLKFAPPNYLLFRADVDLLPRLFKSIYADFNFGYHSKYTFDSKELQEGYTYASLGLRLEFFQHFFLRGGWSFSKSLKYNYVFEFPYAAIGGQLNF